MPQNRRPWPDHTVVVRSSAVRTKLLDIHQNAMQYLCWDEALPSDGAVSFTERRFAMPDPAPRDGAAHRLVAADASARGTGSLKGRLEAVTPMTIRLWESFAIEDLSEDEAEAFWQAIAG